MPTKKYLGELEQMVLLAVLRLRGGAYGVRITEEILASSGRDVSRGSLYVTFNRLESKGLIASEFGDPSDTRGGRRRGWPGSAPDQGWG